MYRRSRAVSGRFSLKCVRRWHHVLFLGNTQHAERERLEQDGRCCLLRYDRPSKSDEGSNRDKHYQTHHREARSRDDNHQCTLTIDAQHARSATVPISSSPHNPHADPYPLPDHYRPRVSPSVLSGELPLCCPRAWTLMHALSHCVGHDDIQTECRRRPTRLDWTVWTSALQSPTQALSTLCMMINLAAVARWWSHPRREPFKRVAINHHFFLAAFCNADSIRICIGLCDISIPFSFRSLHCEHRPLQRWSHPKCLPNDPQQVLLGHSSARVALIRINVDHQSKCPHVWALW